MLPLLAILLGPGSPWLGAGSCGAPSPIPGEYLQMAAMSCPMGDQVNVSVYDFIVHALEEGQTELSREQVKERVAEDLAREGNPELKPWRASIIESPFSHLLGELCRAHPACVATAVYDRGGMAIGLSSAAGAIDRLGITDDARWASMSARGFADSGRVVPLSCADAAAAGLLCTTNYLSVAFPVHDEQQLLGVAHCIMDVSQIHRQAKQ